MKFIEKISYFLMLFAFILMVLSLASLFFNYQYFFPLLGCGLGILGASTLLMLLTEVLGE